MRAAAGADYGFFGLLAFSDVVSDAEHRARPERRDSAVGEKPHLGRHRRHSAFGDRINFHPAPVLFLVTEGGLDEAGLFHKIPRIDDSRLAELLTRVVLAFLVGRELLSPEWGESLLFWRHTGFSIHSRVRAKTRKEAKREGKYIIRPLLSLERLSLDEKEGKVCYRYGKGAGELETMAAIPLTPFDFPASLVFGTGKGERTSLFVTNLGMGGWAGPSLVKIDAGVPGRPLH